MESPSLVTRATRGLPESFARRVPSPFEHALTRRRTREGASRRRGAVLGVKGLRTCRRRTWRTRGRFRELRGRRSPWRPTQTGGACHSRSHYQVLAERDPADLPGLQAGVPERPGWRGCLQADLFAVLSAGRRKSVCSLCFQHHEEETIGQDKLRGIPHHIVEGVEGLGWREATVGVRAVRSGRRWSDK